MAWDARRALAARLAAGAIAGAAAIGIGLFFVPMLLRTGSLTQTLATQLSYFTITTNLLVAVVFASAAAGWRTLSGSRTIAAVALSVALVGVVYALLLRGQVTFVGGSSVADILLHEATPALAPLFWLVFVEKGALSPLDPLLFAIYPVAYVAFALGRGALTEFYPYPFLNAATLGWERALLNVALIALGFMLASWAVVGLDRVMARSSGPKRDASAA